MTDLILIEQLRTYLADQGIVRATPGGAGPLPPCWLNPLDGPAQPDPAKDTAAVSLRQSTQLPTRHLEGFLENVVVEVIVRALKSEQGERLQRQIRDSLNARYGFTMGLLRVQSCLLARGLQPLPLTAGAASKTRDSTQSFVFQVRVADHTVA